jgi:hypothetical protein
VEIKKKKGWLWEAERPMVGIGHTADCEIKFKARGVREGDVVEGLVKSSLCAWVGGAQISGGEGDWVDMDTRSRTRTVKWQGMESCGVRDRWVT